MGGHAIMDDPDDGLITQPQQTSSAQPQQTSGAQPEQTSIPSSEGKTEIIPSSEAKGGASAQSTAHEDMVSDTKMNLIAEQKAAESEIKEVILEGIETDS